MKKLWQRFRRKPDRPIEEIPHPNKEEVLLSRFQSNVDTIPLSEKLPILEITERGIPLEPAQLSANCAQSVGIQRDHNEDALFLLTTTLAKDANSLSFGFYIVADGMGGHQHGEIASETAVRAMASYVIRHLYTPLFSISPQPQDETLQDILQNGVREAQQAVLSKVEDGGTTLTVVLILGDQMTIAHVGDSRVYHIDIDGHIEALTRDHSLVNRLVELGQITPEEAAIHPQRNVLYRALGQGEPFEPETIMSPLPKKGYLLVCSDGLWGVIPQREIGNIVVSNTTIQQACQELISAANAAGGPDNITAILVQLPD